MGHSFVRRFKEAIERKTHASFEPNLGIGSVQVLRAVGVSMMSGPPYHKS